MDGETFTAEATQYLQPNGRKRNITIELPISSKKAYEDMKANNCHLEAELLRTKEVSITVSNSEDDIDIIVLPNGPGIKEALIAMLERKQWQNLNTEQDFKP